MSDPRIDYDGLRVRALRFVVQWALQQAVGPDGPPGDHHFYITFSTLHPATVLPDFLRARYPEEMTIVLKTHFRDLEVDDAGFSVGLWFDGREARLSVPFEAVQQFMDPSAEFVLRFEPDAPSLRLELSPTEPGRSEAEIVSLDAFRRRQDDEI